MVNMGEMFAYPRLINPEMELVPMSDVEIEKYSVRAGDLLFARQSLILEGAGKCSIVKEVPPETTFESHLIRVRLNPELALPEFFFYYLNSNRSPVKKIVTQGVQAGIRASELTELQVHVPPMPTQRWIVSHLEQYDDLIENNRSQVVLLEKAARQIFREWFVRLRFPGQEHETTEHRVPLGWQRMFLPDVIELNPKEHLSREGITFIPMAALSEFGMSVDDSRFERRANGTTVKFRNGDTLLARITPCLENGKTAFVGFLDEGEVASGSTELIVMRGKLVGPCFTYCFARSDEFRGKAIASMTGSSGRQRVQVSAFAEHPIIVPPPHIADEFERVVRPLFEQIGRLGKMNSRLQLARDLLLPRLMSGEIEV